MLEPEPDPEARGRIIRHKIKHRIPLTDREYELVMQEAQRAEEWAAMSDDEAYQEFLEWEAEWEATHPPSPPPTPEDIERIGKMIMLANRELIAENCYDVEERFPEIADNIAQIHAAFRRSTVKPDCKDLLSASERTMRDAFQDNPRLSIDEVSRTFTAIAQLYTEAGQGDIADILLREAVKISKKS